MRSKKLRSGYTTGACAAAASKAATIILLRSLGSGKGNKGNSDGATKPAAPCPMSVVPISSIEIPFPYGSRASFKIHHSAVDPAESVAVASVVKDAGDDPDVTNKAEIIAEARLIVTGGDRSTEERLGQAAGEALPVVLSLEPLPWTLILRGGSGVGRVTKPGLSVHVGEPAINPVPRNMILEAVKEAMQEEGACPMPFLEITISVTNGEELAKKTLNHRLGIVGGISILGTTGIVRPLSTEAWTASITAAMDVAVAVGCREVVISSGRTSEKAHMNKYGLAEEAYVMMGDYLEFSLNDACKHGFNRVHICAQWAKMLKIALSTPQTHVRHGAIDLDRAVGLLRHLWRNEGPEIIGLLHRDFNTAREVFDLLAPYVKEKPGLVLSVCEEAGKYAQEITCGVPVTCHLVSYEGRILISTDV